MDWKIPPHLLRLYGLTLPIKRCLSEPLMSSITNLSVQQLRKAATLKERIQSLEKELGQLLGSSAASVAGPAPKKKKFKMSAAAKAKIPAKLKAIWAARKAAKK